MSAGWSLASGTELRVDAQMDLDTLAFEPAASSQLQMGGFGHAPQTQESSVERLCSRLSSSGHGQLDMVYCHDGHSRRLCVADSYRNRVPKVSHTYRSQRVKHVPGHHNPLPDRMTMIARYLCLSVDILSGSD